MRIASLALVVVAACGGDDDARRLPDAPPFGAGVTLSVTPSSVGVIPGTTATATVTIVREGEFAGPVDIGVTGATAQLAVTGGTIAAGATTLELALSADAAVTAATVPLEVTATVPGLTIAPAPLEARIAGILGERIPGEAAGDTSGVVALSYDGTRLVIGAPLNNGNGNESGHARVFAWDGATWSQLGADIDGETAGDRSGGAVAISADGSRIAVGAYLAEAPPLVNAGHVRVFDWSGTAWTQVGADLDGPVGGSGFGTSVALSASGTRLVVGSPGVNSSAGRVYVYDLVGGAWTQVGTTISGDHELGSQVDLSGDGARMVLSAPSAQSSDGAPGRVQVYELVANDWAPLGAELLGEQASDFFGGALSLSASGTVLAVGAESNDGAGTNAGNVRMFEWTGSAWTQIGADHEGTPQLALGSSVSISDDGARVVAGGPAGIGKMYFYERAGAAYVEPPVPSFGMSARTGEYVAISGDGRRAAVGAIYSMATGSASGEVRVFNLP